ncbi:MAG: hypothetical protein WDO18_02650 [Acidobacteriota bacterium]
MVRDHDQSSPWVDSLLTFLRQIPALDILTFTVTLQNPSESKSPGWLTDRLYSMSRARFDPFGALPLGGASSAAAESIDAIRSGGCEAIIWLAACQDPDTELRNIAKRGVFTVRFGAHHRAIPFWEEVTTASETSATTIFWHDSSFMQGRAIRTAETSTTRGLFITANAEQPLAAAMRMLAALCLDIQCAGAQFEKQVQDLAPQQLDGLAERGYPSNFAAAQFLAKKLGAQRVSAIDGARKAASLVCRHSTQCRGLNHRSLAAGFERL